MLTQPIMFSRTQSHRALQLRPSCGWATCSLMTLNLQGASGLMYTFWPISFNRSKIRVIYKSKCLPSELQAFPPQAWWCFCSTCFALLCCIDYPYCIPLAVNSQQDAVQVVLLILIVLYILFWTPVQGRVLRRWQGRNSKCVRFSTLAESVYSTDRRQRGYAACILQ